MIKDNVRFGLIMSIFLVSITLGCNTNWDKKDVWVFPSETWSESDTVTFNYNVEDTNAWYDVVINLRTTTNYRYSNLWVYLIIEPPKLERSIVAHQIPIAFPDGSWIGKVSGNKVESQLKLKAFQFPESGEYSFKFIQATQEKEIPHVNSIIFSLQRNSATKD